MKHCKKLLPKNIPKIYTFDEKLNILILEYLNEKKFLNLKSEFLKGKINHQLINKISKNLSFIHNNSMKKNIEKKFSPNFRNFYDLRLDAYFNEVKRVHSNLSSFVNNIGHSNLIIMLPFSKNSQNISTIFFLNINSI